MIFLYLFFESQPWLRIVLPENYTARPGQSPCKSPAVYFRLLTMLLIRVVKTPVYKDYQPVSIILAVPPLVILPAANPKQGFGAQ